jgi:hypothetical protein
MKYLYLVCEFGIENPQYFSTGSKDLALDKAAQWLKEAEEDDTDVLIDVLRLLKQAPYTIERYDAIHNKWG